MATQSESVGAPRADVLTAQEAADYIRVPLKTVYELAKTGRMPSCKVGKHYRFNRQAVLDWLRGTEKRVALKR